MPISRNTTTFTCADVSISGDINVEMIERSERMHEGLSLRRIEVILDLDIEEPICSYRGGRCAPGVAFRRIMESCSGRRARFRIETSSPGTDTYVISGAFRNIRYSRNSILSLDALRTTFILSGLEDFRYEVGPSPWRSLELDPVPWSLGVDQGTEDVSVAVVEKIERIRLPRCRALILEEGNEGSES